MQITVFALLQIHCPDYQAHCLAEITAVLHWLLRHHVVAVDDLLCCMNLISNFKYVILP